MAEDNQDPLAAAFTARGEDAPVRAHPLLTDEEVAAAKAAARKLVDEGRRKAALKAVTDEETKRLEREEGMRTGVGVKDELVSIRIDLAEHADRIILNGTAYFHGYTYKVPRHVADSMRDIIAQTHKHQDQVDGKSLTQHYQNQRNTTLGLTRVENVPQAAA